MAVQNPTGKTLGSQDASAVAITGGTATVSALNISDGVRSAVFSANDGGGNLQFEFRSNSLIYFDMTSGADAADYGVRHILSSDNKQYILSANYTDAKFISGLISDFQKPISIQGYYLFAGTTAPTTRPDGTALATGDRFWDVTNRILKSWTGSAFLAPALTEAYNSAANGQSIRKNASTGALEAFTPSSGGGIALTNLSAVSPLSYDNTTGVFTTNIATGSIAGRQTAGTGVIEALTPTQARSVMGLGSAALNLTGDFATAAQGTLAGSALQPGAIDSTVQRFNSRLATISTQANPSVPSLPLLGTSGAFTFIDPASTYQALAAKLTSLAGLANPSVPSLPLLGTSGTFTLVDPAITYQPLNTNLTQIAAVASQTAYGQALLATTQTNLRNSVIGTSDYQVSSTKPTTNSLGGALVAGNIWRRSTDWTEWRYLSGTDWVSTTRSLIKLDPVAFSIPIGSTSAVTNGTTPATTTTVTAALTGICKFYLDGANTIVALANSSIAIVASETYTFNLATRISSNALTTISGASTNTSPGTSLGASAFFRLSGSPSGVIVDLTTTNLGISPTCTYSIPSAATAIAAHTVNLGMSLWIREIV